MKSKAINEFLHSPNWYVSRHWNIGRRARTNPLAHGTERESEPEPEEELLVETK